MISGGRALRHYLFEYGTIPFWNLFLCGGQPELQNPQSFAFTWASLFFYLLPPAPAIMGLWIVMSFVGALSVAKLLQIAGVRSWISWAASVSYVFCGFYGAHFNQGHATFAFFHLIPLMMWLITRHWSRLDDGVGESESGWVISSVVLSAFLFFSAPAIQAMVYIFPMVPVLILVLAATMRRARILRSIEFVMSVSLSLLMGGLLASYKLIPVLFQSLSRRRDDIFAEQYSPVLFVRTFFQFVSRPERMWQEYRTSDLFYGWWEYSAFISPVLPMLSFTLVGLWLWQCLFRSKVIRGGSDDKSGSRINSLQSRLTCFAVLVIGVGLILSLGNAWWLAVVDQFPSSFAMVFKIFLQSVRVFPRYQVLAVFGMTLCSALALEHYAQWLFNGRKTNPNRWIPAAIAVLMAGPSVVQSGVMAKKIMAVPDREIIRFFQLENSLKDADEMGVTLLANRFLEMPGILSVQDLIIRRGHIVDECYDPFYPVRPSYQSRNDRNLRTMVSPPKARLAKISSRSFNLEVAPDLDGTMTWNLPLVPEARFNPKPVLLDQGLAFGQELVGGQTIEVTFPVESFQFGFALSGLGIALVVLSFARKRWSRGSAG